MKNFLKQFNIEVNSLDYYNEALTHNSYSNEHRLTKNYQRLEFLGDAILQMRVSEVLFKKYPKSNEGILTKYRSSIVRKETLAKFAQKIGLGQFIRLGVGELESKGYEKDSILSDVYESITAAIYLDAGAQALENWLNGTIFKDENTEIFLESIIDYKSELQELIQIEMRNELSYITVSQEKIEDNKTLFTVHCTLDGMVYGIGTGYNKKQAEQMSAKNALSKIKKVQ
ncbi:ribonuclease III [Spiroplasma culicicola AES-1]|uniref:Ribonuclease 3 n=1 Tax=Spiroplasma culicicola AES-1 TaxID=1276246 RepID=W6AHL3_9MOLU|nr:ribonuclease III [Spiroplasma culicicola]AHI53184.1 ribonuclease III [Spiroplasma culicicola AES-1]